MRSLFVRFWLSFLAVIAVTLCVATALNFALAIRRAEITDLLSPDGFAATARPALAREGTEGLRHWLNVLGQGHPELQFYFVDSHGRELLNRQIQGQRLPGPTGLIMPKLIAPDGTVYHLIVRRTRSFVFTIGDIFLKPAVFFGLAIVIGGLGSALLARFLIRPIETLRKSVRTLASGDLQAQVDRSLVRGADALGSLARDFDRMVANLRALIASKEELLRDISHELRSPLTRLRLAAGIARRDAAGSNVGEFDRIDQEVERIDDMIGQILRFSRLGSAPAPASIVVDLGELLEETVEDAQIEAAAAHKRLKLNVRDSAMVRGDRAMLRSAIENVIRNAIRFAPPSSMVEVELASKSGIAAITVSDSGPGIAQGHIGRIFEPFFRGDSANGVGLGLAIADRVLALHGGAISATNGAERGLCVQLMVPVASDR